MLQCKATLQLLKRLAEVALIEIVQTIPIPAYVHGISIDFDGYVWGVEFGGTRAFRVDPTTMGVDTYNGLVGAYTYSDMTGFALSSVGAPSG